MVYFFIVILFGLGDGWEYVIGYVICGGLCWLYVFKGFPDMWIYSINMAFCFVFGVGGVLVAFRGPELFGSPVAFFFAGFAFEILALVFLVGLFRSVFRTREKLAVSSEYTPLGIWIIIIGAYFVLCIVAGYGWVQWARGVLETRWLYFLSMLGLMYCAFYIFWVPQNQFSKALESSPKALGERVLKTVVYKDKVVKTKSLSSCPLCSEALIIESRKCPNCDEVKDFSWCGTSEVFVITCPHCSRLTSYNSPTCIVCKNPIGRRVKCKCGQSHPIADWELVDE